MDTASPPIPGDTLSMFYIDTLRRLTDSHIPFLIGGAFAQSRYTGLYRETKDLDVFMRPEDADRALRLLARAGYHTELPYPHWLGKVRLGHHFLDFVFSSGNGVARVDDDWFTNAIEDDVLGMRLRLCPPEEALWAKAYVQERERFDGGDVLHLIRARGAMFDWDRLLARFGDHWPVLLAHLVLFQFTYPDQRDTIPRRVMRTLADRLHAVEPEPKNRVCFGTLLSREQYLADLRLFGYDDARRPPYGRMTPDEIETWTKAIDEKKRG